MNHAFLAELGLQVEAGQGHARATLTLELPAANPLTRKAIRSIVFEVVGEQLIYLAPPELVGGTPITPAFLTPGVLLAETVLTTLSEHLFHLERRSNELTAMEVPIKVDPPTLTLTAELERAPFQFALGCSRQGDFVVTRCLHRGTEVELGEPLRFELSEFRDRNSLLDYLCALFSDRVGYSPLPQAAVQPKPNDPVSVEALATAFIGASLPPAGTFEIVATVVVGPQTLKFAAARVEGRTFRGLLAGPSGKLWSARFELEQFPGVRPLVARVLGVPVSQVEVVKQ